MKKIIIAIDGYSACGKSSTAKAVAQILGYTYIDTGAMYRAVTLYFNQHHVRLTNLKEVEKALEQIDVGFQYNKKSDHCDVYLNGLDVENEIRTMEVTERVSQVSTLKAVRDAMVKLQVKMGKKKGVVMDGRDIGTVVFPDAALKIFMNAEMYVRAERRQKELLEREQLVNLEEIKANLARRDAIDSTRAIAPLKKAEGAIEIDTTHLTLEEQVDEIVHLATSCILKEVRENIMA